MTADADLGEALAAHPLPPVDGDKGQRGALVLVAGGALCPGAAVLAATAALRAGAGRLQIACHPSVVAAVGIAVPEALVVGWDVAAPPPATLVDRLPSASAVLLGPGLDDGADGAARVVAEQLPPDVPLLLDARALPAAGDLADRHLVVLPNLDEARELAEALGVAADGEAQALGRAIAEVLGAVVAVRGETTLVIGERSYAHRGDPGLGASGSGDVLVGFAAGLLARGVGDLAAVAWAVATHGRAGTVLGQGRPLPGYLPRELLDVLPDAVEALRSEAA
jgi:hydroxyethylthiazole kinase-like uncharacterized protein yjeF